MSHVVLALLMLFSDMDNREDMKFAFSAEQGADLSCGFSTLVTFLAGYWAEPSSEEYLIGKYGGGGTVSVRDLLAVLAGEGFAARAYRMDFGQLARAASSNAPLLVHYDRPEGHFALLLDVAGDLVVTSDPALGTVISEKWDFLGYWSGAAIVAKPLSALSRSAPKADQAGTAGLRADPVLLSFAVASARDRLHGLDDASAMDRLAWRSR